MKSSLVKVCFALVLALPLTGCYSMTHTVGNGGGTGPAVEQRTWYALWGLITINPQDSEDLAGGASDYTVETEMAPLDVVLNLFTAWASFVSRTQTVTR